jgi:eukaryotic-like serine/threonine-protein kinase
MSDGPASTSALPAGGGPALGDLLVEQRRRWQHGERVLAETLLERQPSLRAEADAVLDLVYNEKVLRERAGETPRLDEYVARFPHLATQLGDLFEMDAALEAADLLPSTGQATLVPSPDRPPPAAPAGYPQVPGYQVLGVLGEGGMGVVYRAWQLSVKRVVALKMIRPDRIREAEPVARLRTEAEAAGRLQHPHIVTVYEVGEYYRLPFLALEYVEGGSLAARLNGTPWPAEAAAGLVETLARAAHAAHAVGVVHRDLKPANVLLQRLTAEDAESAEKRER